MACKELLRKVIKGTSYSFSIIKTPALCNQEKTTLFKMYTTQAVNAFNGMTHLLECSFTFLDVFACLSVFLLLNKTLRFNYVTAGPEITTYCQFTDLHDNLIRGVVE